VSHERGLQQTYVTHAGALRAAHNLQKIVKSAKVVDKTA
jgi:hypothetical protein